MVHGWDDGLLVVVFRVVILNIAIVKDGEDLIHTLNIFDPRIKLRINKENPMKHISMGLNVFG